MLDLSNLDDLLKLPCCIDENLSFSSIPLLKNDKAFFFVHHYINDSEKVLQFLNRIYEYSPQFKMDCGMYAQIASLVLTNKWSKELILYLSRSESLLWKKKIPQMGYISVTNDITRCILCKISSSSKGLWCIQIFRIK